MFGIQEIDVQTLRDWQEAGRKVRLVDVRSPAEFAQGVIPGCELMPLHLLPLKAGELPRDEEIVLYCRTGARSAQACAFLQQRGFDKVYNLRGGIMDWVRQGNDIARAA